VFPKVSFFPTPLYTAVPGTLTRLHNKSQGLKWYAGSRNRDGGTEKAGGVDGHDGVENGQVRPGWYTVSHMNAVC
jgi:hypothetical protein